MATTSASKAKKRNNATKAKSGAKKWSQHVTETSDAMDLEDGVFTRAPKAIAESLKRSVEKSHRRKSSPFRAAMSMLTFYENRAGKHLDAAGKSRIEKAKDELRKLFGEEKSGDKPAAKKAIARS